MKIIITIEELWDELNKVAKEFGQDYLNVEVRLDNNKKLSLRGYINGHGSHTGVSIEEICNKFRKIGIESAYTSVEATLQTQENEK